MTVVIPRRYHEFIEDGIASGKFRSAEEIVWEALHHFELRERKLDALRADLMAGMEESERGETVSGEEVFAELLGRFASDSEHSTRNREGQKITDETRIEPNAAGPHSNK